MTSHKVGMDRTFNGRLTAHSTHSVSTMVGLVRIVRGATQGQGHGLSLAITAECAKDLGLEVRGGSIWAGACELCMGTIW